MNLKKRQQAKRNRRGRGGISIPPTGPNGPCCNFGSLQSSGEARLGSEAQNRVGTATSLGPGVKGTTKAECQASVPVSRSQPGCYLVTLGSPWARLVAPVGLSTSHTSAPTSSLMPCRRVLLRKTQMPPGFTPGLWRQTAEARLPLSLPVAHFTLADKICNFNDFKVHRALRRVPSQCHLTTPCLVPEHFHHPQKKPGTH